MESYWSGVDGIDKLQRGMYIILPLKYDAEVKLDDIAVSGHKPIEFASEDFIELLNGKCSANGDFVRRFRIAPDELKISPAGLEDSGITVADIQLFAFSGGEGKRRTPRGFFNIEKVSSEEYVSPYYPSKGQVKFFGYLVVFEDYFIHSDLYSMEASLKDLREHKPISLKDRDTSGCVRVKQEDLE